VAAVAVAVAVAVGAAAGNSQLLTNPTVSRPNL
jgi:hypothetical protein